jgi:hypothetical protein
VARQVVHCRKCKKTAKSKALSGSTKYLVAGQNLCQVDD